MARNDDAFSVFFEQDPRELSQWVSSPFEGRRPASREWQRQLPAESTTRAPPDFRPTFNMEDHLSRVRAADLSLYVDRDSPSTTAPTPRLDLPPLESAPSSAAPAPRATWILGDDEPDEMLDWPLGQPRPSVHLNEARWPPPPYNPAPSTSWIPADNNPRLRRRYSWEEDDDYVPPGGRTPPDLPMLPKPKQLPRDFLSLYFGGSATLTYHGERGELQSIHNLHLEVIHKACPVLAMAFEESRSGPQLFLENVTSSTVLPFLQYLYTETYALPGADGFLSDDVPTSLLIHCQLYRLGDIYGLAKLQTEAYVNVLRQCEFSCSSPQQPIALCAAIRYLFAELPEHKRLIDTVLDYCVTRFLEHHLGQDKEFKALAYDLRPFHQALCQNSRDRGFENEAAAAIIQLPYKPYVPETYASREDSAATRFDDVFHFHARDKWDELCIKEKKRKRIAIPAPPLSTSSRQVMGGVADKGDVATPEAPPKEDVEQSKNKRRVSLVVNGARSGILEGPHTGGKEMAFRPKPANSAAVEKKIDLPTLEQSVQPKEEETNLDSDFEIIPSKVDESCDSDSDSSGIVVVKHEDAKPDSDGLIPGRAAIADEDDSDAEWTKMWRCDIPANQKHA